MDNVPLPKSKAWNVADQCREMGLIVGDVIEGREDYISGGFQIARLKVLWIGKEAVMFLSQKKTDAKPEWSAPEERANWTLECRDWYLIERVPDRY